MNYPLYRSVKSIIQVFPIALKVSLHMGQFKLSLLISVGEDTDRG